MSLIRKISPIGLDKVIDNLQNKLFAELSNKWAIAPERYNCHPRCYRNRTKDGYTAELYLGNGEYSETYLNDNVDVTSFFGIGDVDKYNNGMVTSNVHLVFFTDLSKVKSGNSRNDLEARMDVLNTLETDGINYGITINSITTGVENSLKEYSGATKTQGLKYDDMQPFHIFRVDFQIYYQSPTNSDCNKKLQTI